MNHGHGRGLGRCRGHGCGEEEAAHEAEPNGNMATILAEMQAMRVEMNVIRQAQVGSTAAPIAGDAPIGGDAPVGANIGGAGGVGQHAVVPNRPMDLKDWCGMPLEKFGGTSPPIDAADWLSATMYKLEAFQIPPIEWVRYATQLLKGEALVWGINMMSSRLSTNVLSLGGSLSTNLRGGFIQLLLWIR